MSDLTNLLLINPHRSTDLSSAVKIEDVAVSYNGGDGDVVIDIGCVFTKQSGEFPAEKRGLVIVEPEGGRNVLAAVCEHASPEMRRAWGGLSREVLEQKVADYYQFAIFWWNERLSHLPQFQEFLWGFSFLTEAQFGFRNKKFGVSGVVSAATIDPLIVTALPEEAQTELLPGYALRHEILDRQDEIHLPGIIYNYRKSWKGIQHDYPIPTKSPAFDWTHHLTIENCQERGYFSEKLLDCFFSYTVPLYYGDPAIADKFNTDGMIIVQSVDEILDILANLTADDYLKRLDALDQNFKLAKQFITPDETLVGLVKKKYRNSIGSSIRLTQP
jgi:hypothetical protein